MTKQEFLDKFGTLDFTIILADAISGTATAGQCLARYGITDHPQRTLKAMVKLGIMPESELCRFTARKAMSAEDQLMADFGTTDVLSILGPDVLEGRQSISNRLISLGVAPTLVSRWAKKHIPTEIYSRLAPLQGKLKGAQIKATNLERCGVTSTAKLADVRAKQAATNLVRYDAISPLSNKTIKEKSQNTMQNKYGVTNAMHSAELKAKQQATNIIRYGSISPMSNTAVKDKVAATNFKRYGGHPLSLSPQEILDRLEKQGLEPLEPITKNSDQHKTIKVRCKHCGKEFTTRWTTRSHYGYAGHGLIVCECRTHGTNLQHFVRDYIRALGFTCEQRRFEWMDNKEIDCFIPELALGFEINGYLTHNSEWNIFGSAPKLSSYHKAKSEACLANGIRLYHIWHLSDSPEEQAVAKHIIDKALGVYTQRVFARKCKLEETTFADIRDFLDTYHMHGAIPANKYFKLTLDGETLQVMTFKRVAGTTDIWELSRLATKHGVQVIGGSAKLFKHALPTLEGCKQLVSYAYRDFTPDPEDSVYARLGFKFDSFTQPGLSFYAPHPVEFPSGVIINAGVYSRQKFQAHKLAATYGCKTQDLPYLGLYKTFDSGNLKFVYNL